MYVCLCACACVCLHGLACVCAHQQPGEHQCVASVKVATLDGTAPQPHDDPAGDIEMASGGLSDLSSAVLSSPSTPRGSYRRLKEPDDDNVAGPAGPSSPRTHGRLGPHAKSVGCGALGACLLLATVLAIAPQPAEVQPLELTPPAQPSPPAAPPSPCLARAEQINYEDATSLATSVCLAAAIRGRGGASGRVGEWASEANQRLLVFSTGRAHVPPM